MSNANVEADTDAETDNDTDNEERPPRQFAPRVFARELNDAVYRFKESEDQMAPKFSLLPTGGKANRVFHVGQFIESDRVGPDDDIRRARIIDNSGDPEGETAETLFAYAGQYQQEAADAIDRIDAPAYVAMVGKMDTYETDEGDIRLSIRPEYITEVTREQRDYWVLETAEATLDRIETFQDNPDDPYVKFAQQQYTDDVEPYRQGVLNALNEVHDTQ